MTQPPRLSPVLRSQAGGGRGGPPVGVEAVDRSAPRPRRLPRGPGTSASRLAAAAPSTPGPPRAPMAGKALSLLPPLLLAAAGLAGLLLLCVPTRDIREPPALKVHAVRELLAGPGRRAERLGPSRARLRPRGSRDPARSAPGPAG